MELQAAATPRNKPSSWLTEKDGYRALRMELPGAPIPLARPRFGNERVYMKSEQREAMELMQWAIMTEMRKHGLRQVIQKPCRLTMLFMYQGDKKKQGPKVTKPDVDNLVKFVMDAGSKVLWADDNQIYSIDATKQWGAENLTIFIVEWRE